MIIWENEYVYINELFSKTHNRYLISLKKNWKYKRIPRANYIYMINTLSEIPKGFVIHHINYNTIDDRFENLQLLSRKEHNLIHINDPNHFMFRKWHTYWSRPKSESHKQKIKKAHIQKSEYVKLNILQIARAMLTENMKQNEFLEIINRKSHHSIKRITGMNFTSLKKYILWKQNENITILTK